MEGLMNMARSPFMPFTIISGRIKRYGFVTLEVRGSVVVAKVMKNRRQETLPARLLEFRVGRVEKGDAALKDCRLAGYLSNDGKVRAVAPLTRRLDLWEHIRDRII